MLLLKELHVTTHGMCNAGKCKKCISLTQYIFLEISRLSRIFNFPLLLAAASTTVASIISLSSVVGNIIDYS